VCLASLPPRPFRRSRSVLCRPAVCGKVRAPPTFSKIQSQSMMQTQSHGVKKAGKWRWQGERKGLKEDGSVCGCRGQGGYRQPERLGIGSALRSLVEGRGHGYTALAAPYHQAHRSQLQHEYCVPRLSHTHTSFITSKRKNNGRLPASGKDALHPNYLNVPRRSNKSCDASDRRAHNRKGLQGLGH
jgi:hypothetical protein